MGCGGSKNETAAVMVREDTNIKKPPPNLHRHRTPSMSSSSSGVSSAEHTPSPGYQQRRLSLEEQREQRERERRRQQEIERLQLEGHQQQLHRRQSDSGQAGFVPPRVLDYQSDEAEVPDSGRPDQEEQGTGHVDLSLMAIASSQNQGASAQPEGASVQLATTFTPLQIQQHNEDAGWVEWIPHKGKVYDGNGFKSHFPRYIQGREAMLEARRAQRVAAGGEEAEPEYKTFLHDVSSSLGLAWRPLPPVTSPEVWQVHGVAVLRYHGLSEEEVDKEIAPFLLGRIVDTSGKPYWDSVRNDVDALIADLQNSHLDADEAGEEGLQASSQDGDAERSGVMEEYLQQLVRWKEKYAEVDPVMASPADGDPNLSPYPLSVDPETLQVWVKDWETFDTEVPEDGAWVSLDEDKVDLGDPHEVFAQTLRPDSPDLYLGDEFRFDIEGDYAWETLPDDVVGKEEMTSQQEEIHAAREKRTDLEDPERMRRRREQLADHFIRVHELPADIVLPFLQWAELMEKSQAEFQALCEQ